MKCLRNLVGVFRLARVKNQEVHGRAGKEMELASRMDQRVLRCLGRVERMDEYHMTRRVSMADTSGGRVQGEPRLGYMNLVNVALGSRGMTVEDVRQCAKDRKEWRALVHMLIALTGPFLLGPAFFGTTRPNCDGSPPGDKWDVIT